MKVTLISTNLAETPYPVYPLGMAMVAAAVNEAGHEVRQLDLLQHGGSLTALTESVKAAAPDVIGLSIRNIDNVNLVNEQRYIDTVRELVTALRTASPAPIVLGGSGFSLMPETLLDVTGADYGIVGEGEALMVEFLNGAAHNRFPDPPILRSSPSLSGRQIPPARYDRHIMRYYLETGKTAPIQTKRGCTHRCAYCSYPLLEGASLRCREPEAVVDDMQRVVTDYGMDLAFFTDSVFNDDAGHYLEILRLLEKRRLNIPWVAFFKPERFDEATLRLMKACGLRAVELGADASTDATLRGLCKSFSFDDIRACNDGLTAHDIAVAHYYMFGGPGETPATVEEGIRNIVGLKRSVAFMFMGIRILPGTPLERIAINDGVIEADQDLLDPVYYLAPGIDQAWLQATLTEGFKPYRHCIFPPDAFEKQIRLLHKLGHGGVLWDLLAPNANGQDRRRRSRRPPPPGTDSAQ